MPSMPPARESAQGWLRVLGSSIVFCAGALAGCASNITTPLPDLPTSHVSSSLSAQDQKKAVDDLMHVRDTSEQDATREIENSR